MRSKIQAAKVRKASQYQAINIHSLLALTDCKKAAPKSRELLRQIKNNKLL